jgi:Arc/MetJ-type ribon-helix-helix transcriptional regulator
MRRITVTLDEDLIRLVEADVAAGRAPSVSAWVASAELIADLEELERQDPTPPAVIATIAKSLGLSKSAVTTAIKRRSPRGPARRAS